MKNQIAIKFDSICLKAGHLENIEKPMMRIRPTFSTRSSLLQIYHGQKIRRDFRRHHFSHKITERDTGTPRSSTSKGESSFPKFSFS
uniref:Uncharacterized protein n=1 Tax=Rhizophagus irregularis (strain DAOM 181602 / DAOM 197198 / MUCL 43194) TaxID=747089 RepID=U9TIV4_RHIID